jgi:hypothetical protein
VPGTVRHHTAFLRLWAALSTPVLILGIGVLLTRPSLVTLSAFASFLAVAAVEAAARGRIGLFLMVLAAAAVGGRGGCHPGPAEQLAGRTGCAAGRHLAGAARGQPARTGGQNGTTEPHHARGPGPVMSAGR